MATPSWTWYGPASNLQMSPRSSSSAASAEISAPLQVLSLVLRSDRSPSPSSRAMRMATLLSADYLPTDPDWHLSTLRMGPCGLFVTALSFSVFPRPTVWLPFRFDLRHLRSTSSLLQTQTTCLMYHRWLCC